MLKGLDPLLTPELLMHLCAMGHGEWVAVVDANFTADFLSQGRIPVVRIPGHSLERVSRAVLSVFPLAVDVAQPAAYMKVCHSAEGHRTAAQQAVVDLVVSEGWAADRVEAVERYAFYDKIKGSSLIVQSGEATAYGNAMYCKGVILP
jgi:L-fucose mutarotase